MLHELEELIGLLDQQTRLRLDQQLDAFFFRMSDDGLEHLDEEAKRGRPGFAGRDRSARLSRDAVSA